MLSDARRRETDGFVTFTGVLLALSPSLLGYSDGAAASSALVFGALLVVLGVWRPAKSRIRQLHSRPPEGASRGGATAIRDDASRPGLRH